VTDPKPSPGSPEAVDAGCTCPAMDNAHGVGCGYRDDDGQPLFWIAAECPLHAEEPR
jgi:hypothetical protein